MEAQAIRKNKAKKFAKSSIHNNQFKGYIRCGKCGKIHTYRKGPYNIYWICSTFRDKGKSYCDNQQVPDDKIKEAAIHLLNMNKFSMSTFKHLVQQVVALPNNMLRFELKDGSIKEYEWAHKPRSEGWTDEMKEQARQQTLKRYRGECDK
jgi:ssDNA-binding Zn-finger/Zn-ribbon topoisomerase 1